MSVVLLRALPKCFKQIWDIVPAVFSIGAAFPLVLFRASQCKEDVKVLKLSPEEGNKAGERAGRNVL